MYPVLVEIGPIAIRFYGLMYAIAILVGIKLISHEVKRKGLSLTDDNVMNLMLWVVLGGLLGARIYYVVFNWSYYSANPWEIPAIWHGGQAIHGGMIGGIIIGFWFCRKEKVPFTAMADASAPAIILGQVFGRFGNFMNGDAHGLPTTMPWGIVFPKTSIAGREFPGIPLHPTMLYELAINVLIFLLLWKIRKGTYKDGFLFSLYLILYSVGRFFVSFFRADDLMLAGLRMPHLISAVIVLVVGVLIVKKRLWIQESVPTKKSPRQRRRG